MVWCCSRISRISSISLPFASLWIKTPCLLSWQILIMLFIPGMGRREQLEDVYRCYTSGSLHTCLKVDRLSQQGTHRNGLKGSWGLRRMTSFGITLGKG